ncbi:Alpha-1,3-mannosyltransferase cmt1 [Stylosanthes scabra]|uniref:Cytosine-specific methyltransferase n=1 Tax=Stylosanthes scabra TaxID=79078 RepID=A0ABU6SJN7_9FABA|nr:Alpha-1,3-mannosyltransferase cmt1 [Stylosanthes scabra]
MGKRKTPKPTPTNDAVSKSKKKSKASPYPDDCCFTGTPIPPNEARAKWPARYNGTITNGKTENGVVLKAKCHYRQAKVDGILFELNDHVYVKAGDGELDYIALIVEMFETVDNEQYFTAQWFYRAQDTVIKQNSDLVDEKRVFISDVQDDNPLNSIVSKVKIVQVPLDMDLTEKKEIIARYDLYYDMRYTETYHTFSSLVTETTRIESDGDSTVSSESGCPDQLNDTTIVKAETSSNNGSESSERTLLDLYSGCGAMSTGLCFGASISGIKLVTRWAVDINEHACKSLKLNHPETQVRNEPAEDFLNLIKAWAKLCEDLKFLGSNRIVSSSIMDEGDATDEVDDGNEASEKPSDPEEFEVERLLAICYGDPNNVKKPGVYFKVRWKGYDSSEDTWEPLDGLSDCPEVLKEFVKRGLKKKLLPLPGDVDFICGGPPCQGISGFNRFRDYKAPLNDIKNKQLLVFMDIIEFLKPKYVLMENVVDLLKFSGGFLGRYAIGRLVSMNYQARLGILAAGSYGVPQFRMRVFLWGALFTERLPPYPLPTHEAVSRGAPPVEFEQTTVAYDKNESCKLAKALFLGDAISDLPPVANDESQDERSYGTSARTEFQKYIRLSKSEILNNGSTSQSKVPRMLYDHRPLRLNDDDFDRVCQIPKEKGANFRDLPGVLVKDNKVEWDPSVERVLLKSGKPLVPDYAMSFVRGTSSKPFGRLWWDEIVSTVVTRAEPHNQAILHPKQDRVLTIRENARLQGFPDCYKLTGPIKERYIQVGNAVAVPVALALGYTFGLAYKGLSSDNPLTTLPFKYPVCLARLPSSEVDNNDE